MSPAVDAVLEPAAGVEETGPRAAPARTRPLYWSVRRELWENRSIYLAPLSVAVFAVTALLVHGATMPSHMPGMLANDPAHAGTASVSYRVGGLLVLMTTFVVAAFYCLEALSSERRDRSVLFWKSLPVSDRTTVLAKATIPLGVLPLITVAAVVATQLAIFLISAVTLLVLGQGVAPLWGELHLFRLWTAMLYGVAIMMLWHAPVYGFLLLVSGWARRTAVLWAVLPLLALGVVEKLTMNTAYVASMVTYRLLGWYGKAFAIPAREEIPFSPLNRLTPGRILGSADLWLGLAFAALCLAAAARLRRQREPG